MSKLRLKEHPRLYVDADTFKSRKDKLHNPFLRDRTDDVLAVADKRLCSRPLAEESLAHYKGILYQDSTYLACGDNRIDG